MKYIWGIFLFVTGFVGASAMMGTNFNVGGGNSYTIDWESSTNDEREAWLLHEASEIERGMRASLPNKSKGMEVGFKVNGSEVDVDHRRIEVELQMKSYGVLTMSQTEARKMFTTKSCPVYRRSVLANSDVVLRFNVLDARGGKIIQFMNSPRICARN